MPATLVEITISGASPGGWPEFLSWVADKLVPPLAAGACIALFGSLMLARANEAHRGRRELVLTTAQDVLSALSAVQELSATYWSNSQSTLGVEAPVLEAKIEYQLALLRICLSGCGQYLWPNEPGRGQANLVRLLSEVTTDTFGTPGRLSEPDRGRLIAVICGSIAEDLLKAKRRFVNRHWWQRTAGRR